LGGFPGELLAAGTRVVIAPLIHMDPTAAGELTEGFFRAWAGSGASAAQALRSARADMKQRGAPPMAMMGHVLFGPGTA
jgi:CHAT domain-containing protein